MRKLVSCPSRTTSSIFSKRVDGKFLGPGGSSVPEGQALLSGLLDTGFEMAQDIKAREAEDEIAVGLRPIYDRLSEMKAQLDQLCELSFTRTSMRVKLMT